MTLQDLALAGKQMRGGQSRYFRSRSTADLQTSKLCEKAFDRLVDQVLRGPSLFDDDAAMAPNTEVI